MTFTLNRATRALLLITALALTAVVYYPGLHGGYVFDDFPNLVDNPQVQIHALNAASLKGAIFSSHAGILHRPLSMMSFALNYYFFGQQPFSFKLVNLIIHLLNGVGLFILGYQLLSAYRRIRQPALPENAVYWMALAAGAAWLLHPLNLTGVLYVVQRMTSLATLFMIAGLCFYVWGRMRLWEQKRGLHLLVIGLLAFGALSLLSKETGALLPLYMFVIELAVFRFRDSAGRLDKKIVGFFLLGMVLPLIGCLIWLLADPQRFLGGYAMRNFTMTERLLTEARVVMLYLKWTLFPSLNQLGLYHDDIVISHGLFNPIGTLFAVIGIVVLTLSGFLLLKPSPWLGFGILWFLVSQVLESTFLPLEIAFEHRNYLGDYGILLAICYLLLNPVHYQKILPLRRAGVVVFIALLGTLTYQRSVHWSNNVSQALYEALHHPYSPRSVYSAGREMANMALSGKRQYVKPAYDYLQRAGQLDKTDILPEAAQVIYSAKLGKPIDPAWLAAMKRTLEQRPLTPSSVTSLKQ
ncbi:MAG: hypothetical protein KGJ12_08135, partial [Gammaproteobacteria bacterium]|nr:hypothetical protein [Gammaproteobacteria bacterium]